MKASRYGNNSGMPTQTVCQQNTALQLSAAIGTLRRPPVVLCIGSDRVTGDCIGPLVGHLLTAAHADCIVLGTLNEPVTALNLGDAISALRRRHAGRKIIAVDSCVGENGELGTIRVRKGSLRPGLACGKSLPRVGDVSITATVTTGSADSLYSVRLGIVYDLATRIADALVSVLQSCKSRRRATESLLVPHSFINIE